MEQIFNIFLVIHILTGSIGLFTGSINMIRKKGDKNHRLIGKIFLYSMLTTGFSSLIIAYLHKDDFLFIVGVFTIYLAGTGQRYLGMKASTTGTIAQPIDWILSCSMLVFGLIFMAYGGYLLTSSNTFGIVLCVFGTISLRMVYQDYQNYTGKAIIKNFGLVTHLQRMTATYIAATTAFMVVNNTFLPAVVAWMLPTIALTPFIIIWSKKYLIKAKV